MTRRARSDAAFSVYAGLGPGRGLEKTREVIAADPTAYGFVRPPSRRSIEGWSTRDHWVDRIAEIDRRSREEEERELIEQAKAHRSRLRQEGLLLQQKGVQWMAGKEADEVRAGDAIRAIGEGFRLEALGLGEPTERISIDNRLMEPLKELANDELIRLIENLRRDHDRGAEAMGTT